MSKYPKLWRLPVLLAHVTQVSVGIDGEHVPARPLGFQSISSRLRCTWLVFTGRADAVIWPEDEWNDAGSTARAVLAAVEGQP